MRRIHVIKLWLAAAALICCVSASAGEKEYLWPSTRKATLMPDAQEHQIAAMLSDSMAEGFKPEKNRIAYIEWFDAPEHPNGACAILISGGAYYSCCDEVHIKNWCEKLTAEGVQCVNLVYRTPRPQGIEYWRTAWEDGQRGVRKVRSEAAKRGFDPERIGTVSMSAGSHLALLLATSSETPAYESVDALDEVPCHTNWAIVHAPAYITTDAEGGTPATRQGYGPEVKLDSIFHFDSHTCPMSLHHGGLDEYTPNGSTLVYRQLRRMGIPAELHLYAGIGHAVLGFDRGVEFLRQIGMLGELAPEVPLMDRFATDVEGLTVIREDIWPEGKTPDFREGQCIPYIEWNIPKDLKTKAIQIVYSGGAYVGNAPEGFEVTPVKRYLNDLGMAVVVMKYRTPRPEGLPKHITAWQDLQRAIRIVRSEAAERGLDPDQIGIMGSSAGGHLTLMGITSSLHKSYLDIDSIDRLPCNVQWGVCIYPAYVLTDGMDGGNTEGGNENNDIIAPEFSFDLKTSPALFIHGDADMYASMNSVKTWERMRSMGIQSELHTLALRPHCFNREASPGTGSYTYLDRIAEFLKGTVKVFEE